MEPVIVIGAGLAGSEAAWQLARRGIPVTLREMKPQKMTPAHHSPSFGELVCSNSLRSDQLENAVVTYTTGGFRSVGYVMGSITLGSYIDLATGMWRHSAVDVDLKWFSNLFLFRRSRIRQLRTV